MTLQEAYEIQRREKMALQREVNRLYAKIAEYDAGTYVSAEKAKHLKEINRLSQESLSPTCSIMISFITLT